MNLLQNFVYSFGLSFDPRNFTQAYALNNPSQDSLILSTRPELVNNEETVNSDSSSNLELSPTISPSFVSTFDKKDNFFPLIENKRIRNMFSTSQIEILEKVFEQTHYPDSSIREQLSNKLNLNAMRIQVWFQNRRAKYRKMDLEQRKNLNNSSKKNFKISAKLSDKYKKENPNKLDSLAYPMLIKNTIGFNYKNENYLNKDLLTQFQNPFSNFHHQIPSNQTMFPSHYQLQQHAQQLQSLEQLHHHKHNNY